MPRSPAAALLDVDGTLVDTTFHHALAWWRACQEEGVAVDLWRLHRLIGMGSDQLLDAIGCEGRDDLADGWQRHFDGMKAELRPLPGAADLVRTLHERGVRVVYATSGRAEDVEDLRALIGADEWVHATVNSSEVDASKPAPDIFRLALERAGAEPGDAVVVGDTVWDAEAAGACGVACIGVRSGGIADADLRSAGASAVYDDVADLVGSLDGSPLAAILTPR
jgi:HAD superfamily hydrolase (TIGR01509 family)